MNKPEVSIIVAVYNAAKTISACITSLLAQTVPSELIFVDDGSTDTTVDLIKSFPECTVIHTRHHGPAHARNQGAKIASGTILVFVDADMTFDTAFIERLTAPIKRGETQGTWTKEELVANWDNPLAKAWNIEYTHQTGQYRIPPDSSSKGPVFRAIRKSEFDRTHGFSEIGYNDDWTLAKKLHYFADAAPGAIMYHHNPATWIQIFRQAAWSAKREYKLGQIGRCIAFIRATLPMSVLIGCLGVIRYQFPVYLPFKLWYDLAVCYGIISYWITGKTAK